MKRILFPALKVIAIYVLVILAWAGISYGSLFSQTLANFERKLSPANVVFWQSSKLWYQPPSLPNALEDPKGHYLFEHIDDYAQIDVWFLMLDGFEDIRNVPFATDLRIDVEKIAESEPGTLHYTRRAGVQFRLAALPIGVKRTEFHILDMRYWFENYRHACLNQMVLNRLYQVTDNQFREDCKRAGEQS